MLSTINTYYFFLLNILSFITPKSNDSFPSSHFNGGDIHLYEVNTKSKKLFSIGKNHSDSLDFSFASERQSIRIWTKDLKNFKGTLTNVTTKISNSNQENIYKENKPKRHKEYKNTVKIDPEIAKQVYIMFNDAGIFTIPDGKDIKGWRIGVDGLIYTLKYSTPNKESIKQYWTPEAYVGKIKEADKIVNLVEQLKATLNMKDSFDRFFNTLPNGCYNVGSIIVWCKEE
jgi:hypothetical protein